MTKYEYMLNTTQFKALTLLTVLYLVVTLCEYLTIEHSKHFLKNKTTSCVVQDNKTLVK